MQGAQKDTFTHLCIGYKVPQCFEDNVVAEVEIAVPSTSLTF